MSIACVVSARQLCIKRFIMSTLLTTVATQLAAVSKSDEEHQQVATEARCKLLETRYWQLRQIDCKFDGGTLVLSGRVDRYYYKQVAQNAVMDVAEVEHIVNDINVD